MKDMSPNSCTSNKPLYLILGCGHECQHRLGKSDHSKHDDSITIDSDEEIKPDIIYELNHLTNPMFEEMIYSYMDRMFGQHYKFKAIVCEHLPCIYLTEKLFQLLYNLCEIGGKLIFNTFQPQEEIKKLGFVTDAKNIQIQTGSDQGFEGTSFAKYLRKANVVIISK